MSYLLLFLPFLLYFKCFRVEPSSSDLAANSKPDSDWDYYNVKKLFDRLRKYKLRLNPSKCVYRVSSDKLLGHIVNQREIEMDPAKAKAIVDMPPPKIEKEVRGLLGRLQYISRFIAQLTPIYEPIFKLLRKNAQINWSKECQAAFDKIKQLLTKPPVLVPPTLGRPLLLYLSTMQHSMGTVLG